MSTAPMACRGAMAAPERFDGLALADSLSLDAHKWLYQPIDCGCLLYRDAEAARKTFSISDDYVRILNEDPAEAFAFFEESFELSRRFRALKLWMSLQYHGRRAYREAILRDLAHAELLAETIDGKLELEPAGAGDAERSLLPSSPQGQPGDPETGDCARPRLPRRTPTIGGQFALRACFVNHRTTEDEVREIVSEVLAAAGEVNA